MKRNSLLQMIFFLAGSLFILGCGGSGQKTTVEHKVGEAFLSDKLSLSIDSVTRNLPKSPEDTNSQEEDIGIHITVINKAKYSLSFKMENLVLRDAKNKKYSGYPQGGPGSMLSTSRHLAMGDRITGTLIYTIPSGSTGLRLVYESDKEKDKIHVIKL
jgi:hypothetical protein